MGAPTAHTQHLSRLDASSSHSSSLAPSPPFQLAPFHSLELVFPIPSAYLPLTPPPDYHHASLEPPPPHFAPVHPAAPRSPFPHSDGFEAAATAAWPLYASGLTSAYCQQDAYSTAPSPPVQIAPGLALYDQPHYTNYYAGHTSSASTGSYYPTDSHLLYSSPFLPVDAAFPLGVSPPTFGTGVTPAVRSLRVPAHHLSPGVAPRRYSPLSRSLRELLDSGKHIPSRGRVKFFNARKGYGFIVDDQSAELQADVFAHYTGVDLQNGFRCLAKDERVEYTLTTHSKGGYQALCITGEHGAPLKGLSDPHNAAILREVAAETNAKRAQQVDPSRAWDLGGIAAASHAYGAQDGAHTSANAPVHRGKGRGWMPNGMVQARGPG